MADSSLLDGFRVGDYFVAFPPGDFVVEDDNGMSVKVEIYKMSNDKLIKADKNSITPELEEEIQKELNRMLEEALNINK